MNPGWLFYHIIDVLRSPSNRPPVRDVYCPEWLAVFLGAAGLAFLFTIVAHGFWSMS